MCFSAKGNRKLSASVGQNGASSLLASTVLDTGPGPNAVYKRRADPVWHAHIRPVQSPTLLKASKRVTNFCRLIYLTVCTGEFGAAVPFFAVQSLAVEFLLETSFTDHFVKATLPGLRKATFYPSRSVAIIGKRSFTKPQASLDRPKASFTLKLKDRSQKNRTTRRVIILPMS